MEIYGFAEVTPYMQQEDYFLKCIVNESGAAFFPPSNQHRDMKIGGLSYEDDYKGNALAATFTRERIDIRYHSQFSDDRVGRIFSTLMKNPEVGSISETPIFYQARRIALTA